MACYKGKDGVVKIAGVSVGQVMNFSLEETVDTVECTHMGDDARDYEATFTTWTASAEVRWDPDDAGQEDIVVGATVTLNLYPEGDTVGDTEWTGSAIVTNISETVDMEELISASFEFQGKGALTRGTVAT